MSMKRKDSSSPSSSSKRRRSSRKNYQTLNNIQQALKAITTRLDHLQTTVDNLQTTVDAIASTLPEVQLRDLSPYILPSARNDVIFGAISTFTITQIQIPGSALDNSFWAIGAAHCGVYYGGCKDGTFIHLPKSLCEMGVTHIMFPTALESMSTCYQICNDFIAACVPNPTPTKEKPLLWDPSIDTQQDLGSHVGGLSTSGFVLGSMLTYDQDHFVFVEDKGEPGHSGTAMVSGSKHLLGVYSGTKAKDGNLRTRSIIAPLPDLAKVTILECKALSQYTQMKMRATSGSHTFTLKRWKHKGNVYATYQDGENTYSGVVIPSKIPFIGQSMAGQAGRPL